MSYCYLFPLYSHAQTHLNQNRERCERSKESKGNQSLAIHPPIPMHYQFVALTDAYCGLSLGYSGYDISVRLFSLLYSIPNEPTVCRFSTFILPPRELSLAFVPPNPLPSTPYIFSAHERPSTIRTRQEGPTQTAVQCSRRNGES